MDLLNNELDTSKFLFRVNLQPFTRLFERALPGIMFFCAGCLLSTAVLSADPKVTSTLQQYVGKWETSIKWGSRESDQPINWEGTTNTELIGPNWITSRHLGDYLGIGYDASESLGFDERKQLWTSIWVDRNLDSIQIMTGKSIHDDNLQLSGKIKDDESDSWFSLNRTDRWVNNDEYVTNFIKLDEAGETVEELIVTHKRVEEHSTAGETADK